MDAQCCHLTSRFVDSFIESAMAAGMAEGSDQGEVVLLEHAGEDADCENGDPEPETGEPSPELAPPITPRALQVDPGPQTPTVHQAWSIDGGEIVLTIRTGGALPAASFQAIGEIVGALEKLATSLNAEDADEEIESEL